MGRYTKIGRYFLQKGKGKEANRLEREALEDPFLYEALEGLEQIPGKHARIMEELQEQIQYHSRRKKNFRTLFYSAVTAACILLAAAVSWLLLPERTEHLPQLVKSDVADKIVAAEIAEAEIEKSVGDHLTDPEDQKPDISVMSCADLKSDEKEMDEEKVTVLPAAAPLRKLMRKIELEKRVEGFVTDEKGTPLAGAILMAGNSPDGTVTDTNGYFRIQVPDSIGQLRATYTGRLNKVFHIPEQGMVYITLAEDDSTLGEIRVTGDGCVNAKKERRKGRKEMPAIVEGQRDFLRYVADSLRYPEDARLAHLEGEVVLGVHLNKRGRPSRIKLLRKLSRSCDGEAIRLVEEYKGNWGPENRNFTIHIPFRLSDIKN